MRKIRKSKASKNRPLEWSVHTVALIKEVLNNPGTGVLHKPLNIFKDLLAEVAQRALELNDLELNALMCRLTLYEQADPYSKDYNHEGVEQVLQAAYESKIKRTNKTLQ